MSDDTVYMKLRAVKRTGHTFLIKPLEEVMGVNDTPDQVTVFVKYVKLIERRCGFDVQETGIRMVSFTERSHGGWDRNVITVPDDEPDFEFVRTYGASVTPSVWNARIDWATMCHRPGSGRQPLDNEERTRDDYAAPRMKRHWNVRAV